jgi:hypothetical protein
MELPARSNTRVSKVAEAELPPDKLISIEIEGLLTIPWRDPWNHG